MSAVYTYSPSDYTITVAGQKVTGFTDGAFIEVAPDEQLYNKHVGADGYTSRARTSNRSGTITITLARTSPSNEIMSAIMKRDIASDDGIVPVNIKDSKGRTVIEAPSAWVQSVPTLTDSKDIEPRTWVLDCSNLTLYIGGNTSASGQAGNFADNADQTQQVFTPNEA